jgi:ATP-dependent protease ClpP protease subunit
MLEYDTYLNPKESLEFGLIDEIGVVKWWSV